ncbi:MAG: hypothetical protein ACPG5P_02700, partial [Saprospiraceae bacterium]
IVQFINPSLGLNEVTKSPYIVKAKVLNVMNKNQIVFQMNGKNRPFSYNASTKLLTSNVTLVNGKNTFKITATNNSGSDFKIAFVKYKKPSTTVPSMSTIEKPTVEITGIATPVASPMNPNPGKSTLDAKVTKVLNKSQIEVLVNDVEITDFVFRSRGGTIEAKIDLQSGRNEIIVRVKTPQGTAEDVEIVNK